MILYKVLAYIDPNTVHTVFSGVLPILLGGITFVLAVLVWPLVIARRYLSKWFGLGSRSSWDVIVIAGLALLAGLILVYILVCR